MLKLTFVQWVNKQGGAHHLAARLNVSAHTVRVWLRGAGAPQSSTISKILQLSNYKLTFNQIINETTRNKK